MADLKVQKGDRPSASKWNRVVDRLPPGENQGYGAAINLFGKTVTKVINTTGVREIGELLFIKKYGGPTTDIHDVAAGLVFETELPAWHDKIERIVVCAGPIPADEQGFAGLSGLAVVRVSNSNAEKRFVQVDPQKPEWAKVATGGFAKIIEVFDTDYVLCAMGEPQNLWKYRVDSEIQEGQTSGTVKLLELDDTDYDDVTLKFPDGVGCKLEAGQKGYCIQAGNEFHGVSTQSSYYGEATEKEYVKSIEFFGCDIAYPTEKAKLFCAGEGSSKVISPQLIDVPVLTALYASGSQICASTATVKVCNYDQGENDCVDICPLLCECEDFHYTFPDICDPPPPPPCYDFPCQYAWDEPNQIWNLIQPCPPDRPECECPDPPASDGLFDGEIVSYYCNTPPPPPDCDDATCAECVEHPGELVKLKLTALLHSDNANGNDSGSFSLQSWNVISGCEIRFLGQWNRFIGNPDPNITGTVTKEGNDWRVTFDNGPMRTKSYTYDANGLCNYTASISGQPKLQPGESASLGVEVECVKPALTEAVEGQANAGHATMGKAFIAENKSWFTGCGCKAEVTQIMNRWKSKDDVKDSAIDTISKSIANKTKGIDVVAIHKRLREFITRWFDAEG